MNREMVAAAVAVVLALTGCSTARVSPGSSIADFKIASGRTVLERAVDDFAAAFQLSAAAPGDAARAFGAYRLGLVALELQCDRYLDGVGLANQAAANERKQTNLAGGLVSSLMGLTGSTSKQVAGVAAGFSFAGSSMDAYTTTYLFSDAASAVTRIVRQSQAAYLDGLRFDAATLDYPNTVRLLLGYEAVCRPAQIRALIDEAVAKTAVVAESPASAPRSGPAPRGPGGAASAPVVRIPLLTTAPSR